MSYSLDANILLYAANSSCPENARAVEFIRSCAKRGELLCLAWPTIAAFLRISTHPAIFPNPLGWAEAREYIDSLLELPQVRVISELDGFWEVFCDVAKGVLPRGNLVADAHLAAILKQNEVATFYTNDSDFRRFEFLNVRNPLA